MTGSEWVVEAYGCDAVRLADLTAMRAVFAAIIAEVRLNPVGDAVWHRFPEPGGMTGMQMLAESHLTVHTFPEHGSLCLNLFCCTPRPVWAFDVRLGELVGTTDVRVTGLLRHYGAVPQEPRVYRRVETNI